MKLLHSRLIWFFHEIDYGLHFWLSFWRPPANLNIWDEHTRSNLATALLFLQRLEFSCHCVMHASRCCHPCIRTVRSAANVFLNLCKNQSRLWERISKNVSTYVRFFFDNVGCQLKGLLLWLICIVIWLIACLLSIWYMSKIHIAICIFSLWNSILRSRKSKQGRFANFKHETIANQTW